MSTVENTHPALVDAFTRELGDLPVHAIAAKIEAIQLATQADGFVMGNDPVLRACYDIEQALDTIRSAAQQMRDACELGEIPGSAPHHRQMMTDADCIYLDVSGSASTALLDTFAEVIAEFPGKVKLFADQGTIAASATRHGLALSFGGSADVQPVLRDADDEHFEKIVIVTDGHLSDLQVLAQPQSIAVELIGFPDQTVNGLGLIPLSL